MTDKKLESCHWQVLALLGCYFYFFLTTSILLTSPVFSFASQYFGMGYAPPDPLLHGIPDGLVLYVGPRRKKTHNMADTAVGTKFSSSINATYTPTV